MSEILSAVGTAPTTTPRDTYSEVSHTLAEGVLLYRPEDNCFIALYPDEWLACRAEAHENKTAIEALQDANRVVTEKSQRLEQLLQQPNSSKAEIVQAQAELDAALNDMTKKSDAAKKRIEAIANQKTDQKKLVELVPMTLKRIEGRTSTPIYIRADLLRSASADSRIYMVNGPAERRKRQEQKLFDGAKLNVKEARSRILGQVQDAAKFEKKWKLAPKDADQYSGILTDWAKVMGVTVTECLERSQKELAEGLLGSEKVDPDNPQRVVDLKPEAQFMRWSAGAGSAVNFMPFQGNLFDGRDSTMAHRLKRAAKSAQFNIKANAEASFAVGEGKVQTSLYLPHAAGWRFRTGQTDQSLDLGYFRLRGDVTLYAMAGASIALEASASLMVNVDKQGLRGTPPDKLRAAARLGSKGEAKVFAGLKEGIALTGALQWLNPEGFIDPAGPRKIAANKAIAQYVDMASVSADAAFIQGLAASAGFECAYRDGNFIISASGGVCFGLGFSKNVAAKVGVKEIAQFFMFIAHQLKQADYKKIKNIIQESAFYTLNSILCLNIMIGENIENFVGKSVTEIKDFYTEALERTRQQGKQTIKQMEQHFKSGWGWYSYMPPESRGAVIANIIEIMNQPQYEKDFELRNIAAFSINELMSTTQSSSHIEHTLARIVTTIGEKSDRPEGIRRINSVLSDTKFENCVYRCEMQLANAGSLNGRPFMRNDEPDFVIAHLQLHHPGYMLV